MKVPFLDLKSQYHILKKEVDSALKKLTERSDFILGADEKLFESEFAAYNRSHYAVGLNSGTDALFLSLLACGVGPGDEVIVPAFTFIATANAVSYTGAKPVFCDIDEKTYTMDPEAMLLKVTRRTKAVIPVHLFGQCCDMLPIMRSAKQHGLKVIEDACQAHGAEYHPLKRKAGTMGDTGTFSFYPTKNLGGWGDGGMATTESAKLDARLRLLRDCGRKTRYQHSIVGYNSRLDTIQAAVLRPKLVKLDSWNAERARKACLYEHLLKGVDGITLPWKAGYSSHVFHIFAVRAVKRARLLERLKERGIGFMVNYPLPLHLQPAYRNLGHTKGDFPNSEKVCREIVSLPMHPFITGAELRFVADTIKEFYAR